LSPALKDEGLAREVVRGVQNLRKTVNLELDDRIRLALISDDADLRRAVETHKAYIMAETLAVEWNLNSLGASASGEDMKIEQAALRVEIQKS
jgi:isoleucyl-tRNA synthetase